MTYVMLTTFNSHADNENENCRYYSLEELNKVKQSNKKQHLNSLHLNIQSLFAHIDELKTLLTYCKKTNFDLIGITESRQKKGETPITNTELEGYNSESCPTESSAGGVSLYISNKITNYKKRNDLQIYKSKQLESVFIEIMNKKTSNIIVGCIYRHPCMHVNDFNENFLAPLLEKISFENKTVLLMGNFNINLLKHQEHSATAEFFDLMTSHGLFPQITDPTRITPRSKTLIDNIFLSSCNDKLIPGNITTSISDHLPQFLLMESQQNRKQRISNNMTKRNLKTLTEKTFC